MRPERQQRGIDERTSPGAGEKAAQRNDLPGSTSASPGVPVGELGDTANNAGTAGSGSGNQGNPKQAKDAAADPDSVRANPPVKSGGDRNSAAGGTKPPEPIQTGTPRSPQ